VLYIIELFENYTVTTYVLSRLGLQQVNNMYTMTYMYKTQQRSLTCHNAVLVSISLEDILAYCHYG